jgi:Mg-chelatase subunit ChlD
MQEEDRILALRDTLGRVAKFATILNSSGISIRMLNYNHDENGIWDHLSTVDDVIRKMDKVSYTGGTPLGTRLWSKILKPLIIDKASSGELKKPVIVIVITDGEASHRMTHASDLLEHECPANESFMNSYITG